jgi:hypothetical protein
MAAAAWLTFCGCWLMSDALVGCAVRVLTVRGALLGALMGSDARGLMLRRREGRVYIPWAAVIAVAELRGDMGAPLDDDDEDTDTGGEDDALLSLWG